MIAALLFLAASFAGGPPGADGLLTVPGAINPTVTQANIQQTICVPGWTKTVRPPVTYTNKLKFALMDEARIPRDQARQYELDHDISLEIGGAPSDPGNLSLEPYFGPRNAHDKDKVENVLHRLVCSCQIGLADAQREISTDWVSSYRKRIGPLP